MAAKNTSERLVATSILGKILAQKGSLSTYLPIQEQDYPGIRNAPVQALCYGVCRYYQQLDFFLSRLMSRPLRNKENDLKCLLLISLFQLYYMDKPAHAIVNEAVKDVLSMNKQWARGLTNAVLREAMRQKESLFESLSTSDSARFSFPQWIIDLFQQDWPEHYQQLLDSQNQHPPMTLRVNLSRNSRDEYQAILKTAGIVATPGKLAKTALLLENPLAVSELPGFLDGLVSVQDEASQLASLLLPGSDMQLNILDACAAPGGKSCAILEQFPADTRLTATDSDKSRVGMIEENFQRLALKGDIIAGDMTEPGQWWNGELYDRILVDAPCTATGVIRRHPDIKLLRKATDLAKLGTLQSRILDRAWEMLKPGGYLLYSTCSLFKQENNDQISSFVAKLTDFKHITLDLDSGQACPFGYQLFPGNNKHDGFYYALLQKC